jgi:uncharacterized protein (DUF849 family)
MAGASSADSFSSQFNVSMHARKTIITCAVTGNIVKPDQHPGLPITPEQIANAALEAAEAGAAVAHIHVRDPETGKPSMRLDYYADVIDRIRARNRALIINLTTGPGGRFVPDEDEPRVAAAGTTLLHPLKRVEHIAALRPDVLTRPQHDELGHRRGDQHAGQRPQDGRGDPRRRRDAGAGDLRFRRSEHGARLHA